MGTIELALEKLLPDFSFVFVYGSVAKGSEGAASDVDLMVVGDGLSYANVMEALIKAEKQLARTINPTIYDEEEFRKRWEANQSFVTRVMSQDVLWIKGFELFKEKFGG